MKYLIHTQNSNSLNSIINTIAVLVDKIKTVRVPDLFVCEVQAWETAARGAFHTRALLKTIDAVPLLSRCP